MINETMKLENFNRVGNWYTIQLGNDHFSVLIVKDTNSIICDPSSILLFDHEFNQVNDPKLYEEIEEVMRKVDWKYDMIDQED